MESVIISIQPKWCQLIASGKKTVEVRKTKPKIETPFKVYLYCTSIKNIFGREYLTLSAATNGKIFDWHTKVIGEFICDDITWSNGLNLLVKEDAEATLKGTCITKEELFNYLGTTSEMSRCDKKTEFYRWHISDLVIYDKPKKLGEFGLRHAPQSWCYV